MSTPIHEPTHVVVGRITKPHNLKGEVKVEIMTADPGRFSQLEFVFLGRRNPNLKTAHRVISARLHKNQVLLKLEGFESREQADRLRNQLIFVPFEEAIPLEEGEFFIFQLYGMTVVAVDGQVLGTVQEVLQTGANDVLIVRGEPYGEILIPDIEEVVLAIDGGARQITVNLLPGLLPE